jgi:phage tail sheath protein FI
MVTNTPGVYIEEQAASGPIAGVGTSTAAFLGAAEKGDVATPVPVGNLTRFAEQFTISASPPTAYRDLILAVHGFFENGGTSAYIVRVSAGGTAASLDVPDRGEGEDAMPALVVTALEEGSAGNDITVSVAQGSSDETFTLVVNGPGYAKETFKNKALDSDSVAAIDSALVKVSLPDRATRRNDVSRMPSLVDATNLDGGTDDNPGSLTDADWLAGLVALGKIDDVSLVCAPGVSKKEIQQELVKHCKAQGRFAILDAAQSATTTSVLTQRADVASDRGFAALYFPWLTVADPTASTPGANPILVPPSGHVAGVYARVDAERGVHKAPANESIIGAQGIQFPLDDSDQGPLNAAGVNVLRVFAGSSRPVVWGARTTANVDDLPWRYVNVRRLMSFIEESVQEGIRWAVFEPNDVGLWKRIERTVSEFLTRVWASGALFGASAEEAFYVKIDEELNPSAVRDLGQVVVEVGVAPVKPAEFVRVKIGLWSGGAQAEEG